MRGHDVTTGTGGRGGGPLHFDGWLAPRKGVILHLVAGDMEAADKRTKERDGKGLVVIEKRRISVERSLL